MKPRNIFLIRHGESEGNADRKVYETKPDHSINLTALGRQQASDAGKHLSTLIPEWQSIQFYTSPFTRARQTYENIKKQLPNGMTYYREDPRIREQEWGHLTNLDQQQAIDKSRNEYSPFYYRIPDGESCADVFDRVSCFLNTLHRNFENEEYPENTVIVTHGMLIRVFLMRWFHWTVEEFENLHNPENCQIIHLALAPDQRYILKSELRSRV